MKYINTANPKEEYSFQEALKQGLAPDKGLFIPQEIPVLPASFFGAMETMSQQDIAFEVLYPFVKGEIPAHDFRVIITETFHFPIPTVPLNDNLFITELFHGPTKAFKDIGAKFMAKCLQYYQSKHVHTTVLVATSGDTGSAVANGFYNAPGVSVRILFPKDKVSPFQEYQMTSLGKNIKAIEVNGTFDDCQFLVKETFSNPELKAKFNLTSANSINIARLLPQMLFYFFTYKNMKQNQLGEKLVISVPSGNLGNLTAGLYAKQMGLPISRLVAALNQNDSFAHYLKDNKFTPKPTVETLSNAMDVGNPSNIQRIISLYDQKKDTLSKDVIAYSFDNQDTLNQIQKSYQQCNYILDPHSSVGILALKKDLKENEVGVVLGTAHPCKFEQVIQQVIPAYPSKIVELKDCSKTNINPKVQELVTQL
jgi:threonine synthase